jgi:anti-anti-sigma factor
MILPMATSGDPAFTVRCERRSGVAVVVVVEGELDIATAGVLEETLNSAAARAPVTVLDLRAVGFIDSSGLSVVVKYHRHAEAARAAFAIAAGAESKVRRLLTLSGLAEVLELTDDPDVFIAANTPRRNGDPA